ncbi:RING finger protein 10 [Glycine soja]|uniref:RING finger protein 10 n=1 Tax=Glycine soja TaxID=3848 RepID=A0A445FEL4_GLYSO|nr:RING finger protein 10 [Glycine soja]
MSILPSQTQAASSSSSSAPSPNPNPQHGTGNPIPQPFSSLSPSPINLAFGSLQISDTPGSLLDLFAFLSILYVRRLQPLKILVDLPESSHGSAPLPGRKAQTVNGNYLLNFQYDPISRSQPRGPPPPPTTRRHRKRKPYSKDLFLQANYKFTVLGSGNYSPESMDPDKMLQWEDIICVTYLTPFSVQCPICLEYPLCPQITSCGHIFCFPCILQYLLMGEADHKGDSWKRCPLCFVMISAKDLYTVHITNVKQYQVRDNAEFTFLTRKKDSFTLSLKNKQETNITSRANEDICDPFSKFTLTSDVDLSVRHAISDLDGWLARADSGLVDDLEKLPYVCAAMQQLEQRKRYWSELRSHDSEKSSKLNDYEHQIPSTVANSVDSDDENCSNGSRTSSSDFLDQNKVMMLDKSTAGICLDQKLDVEKELIEQEMNLSSSYEEKNDIQRHSSGVVGDVKENDSYSFYQVIFGSFSGSLVCYIRLLVQSRLLSNGGNGGAMAVLHDGNLKKRYRIAVAWRVYNGGTIAMARGNAAQNAARNQERHPAPCSDPARSSHRAPSSDDPTACTHDPVATSTGTRRRRAPADDPAKAMPHRPCTLTKANVVAQFSVAADGQHLILHPLNMKCLLHHYGSYDMLPHRISGRILQLESVTQSEAIRRRYRFLSHFPLTTTFQLCEVDLSEMLPPEAFSPFMDEIKKRANQRKQLAKKEKKEKIMAEATAAYSLPISLSHQFTSRNDPPTFSMDDFEALGNSTISSSPPLAGERKSFSNVTRLGFAAAHDSPSLQIQETSGLHNNNTTADSSVTTGLRNGETQSYSNVTSRTESNISSNAPKTNELGKKGKKPNRVLLSTAGGRRY